jgi:resolvase-like protein
MRVGIYARVSTDTQQTRATIGSQLQTLRARIAAEGDDLVDEFIDDGYSGARLDRPRARRRPRPRLDRRAPPTHPPRRHPARRHRLRISCGQTQTSPVRPQLPDTQVGSVKQ